MSLMFDLILLAMSVYILIGGITGKGKLYKADNVKEGKEEEFHKKTKRAYLLLGIVMFIHSLITTMQGLLYSYNYETNEYVPAEGSALAAALDFKVLRIIGVVFFILTILSLVLLIVLMRRYTDTSKGRTNNAAQNEKQKGHILPVDAFDFTEEETAEEAEPEQTAPAEDVQEDVSDETLENAELSEADAESIEADNGAVENG